MIDGVCCAYMYMTILYSGSTNIDLLERKAFNNIYGVINDASADNEYFDVHIYQQQSRIIQKSEVTRTFMNSWQRI